MVNLRGHYVAVCQVPVKCTKEQIFGQVKKHLRGRLLDVEQIPGIESSRDLTRWVLWLETHEDANALCDLGRADIEVEGENHVVTYERPLVCQVPEQWEKNIHDQMSPEQKPFVTPRRRHPNPAVHQQQQFLGPLGMQSGFYHNFEPKVQFPIPTTGFEQYPGPGRFHGQHVPGYNQGNLPPNFDGRSAGHKGEHPGPAYEALRPVQNLHDDGNYEALNQFSGGHENQTSGQKYGHPEYNMGIPMVRPPNMPPMPLQQSQPQMPMQQNQPRMTSPTRPHQPGSPQRIPFQIPGQHNIHHQPRHMHYGYDLRTRQPFPMSSPNNMQPYNPDMVTVTEKPSPSNTPGRSESVPSNNLGQDFGSQMQGGNISGRSQPEIDVEVAKQVAEKGDHVIKKVAVSVKLFNPPKPEKPLMQEQTGICTIVVTGPKSVICESEREMIEMYFENERYSSGGPIETVRVQEGVAYITFKEEGVAKRVSEKANHAIKKCPVDVSLFFPETQQPDEPSTKIVLLNLPSTIHEEFISLFFESKKLKAGTVLSVDFDEEQGTAIVEFEDPASIDVVMDNLPIEMMGQKIDVEIYNPQPLRRCTVQVAGPSDIVCEEEKELLSMYFENLKKSGGGPVEKIVFEGNAAFVTFESEEDAQRVADKTDHVVRKRTLSVQLYIPEPAGKEKSKQGKDKRDGIINEDESSVTVKIKGIKDLKSRDTLEFYFENTKRSGGEEFKDFRIDEEDDDVLYVVYESPEVAKRVAERAHVLDGVNLTTSLYVPPKLPPSYPDKVLIKGLKPTTTEDGLFNFIEAKSGYIPVPGSMVFHAEEEGVVMITLDKEPDFEILGKMCANKLDGVNIKMSQVPISNCILVSNLPSDVTKDTLEYYFENTRRSGGGPVQAVDMNEDDSCFVYFKNHEDVDSVLKKEHSLNSQIVEVKRYQKCLGRAEGEPGERKLQIPEPVLFTDAGTQKTKFVRLSKTYKASVEKQMHDCHTTIVWSSESDEITLHCTLSKDVKDCFKLVKTWKDCAMKILKDLFDCITVHHINILQDLWQKVMENLKNISIDNPEAVAVFTDKKEYIITVVGMKTEAEILAKNVDEIIKKIMDEAELEKQKVKESMTNLRPIETHMLLADQFPNKVENLFPGLKVKINKNTNEILFEGLMANVRDAKLKLYEMKSAFAERKIRNLSGSVLRLFQSREVKNFIVNKLKTQQVAAVWEIKEETLVIVSSSNATIDKCIDIIKTSVTETSIGLSKASASVMNSERWTDQIREWHEKYVGISHVAVDDKLTKVIICSTDDINNDLLEKVKKFLRLNTVYEETVSCDRDVQRLIETKHKNEVTDLCKGLQNYFVEITFLQRYGGFGLKGTTDGLETAKAKINEMMRKVKQKDHTVEKPGLEEHMRSKKGKESLSTIESVMPCVISVKEDAYAEQEIENSYEVITSHVLNSSMNIKASCKAYNFRNIFTAVGDMTELSVNVIVNTTDERLNLGGGLGKIIAKKGGSVVVEACKEKIQKDGRLSMGKVFLSPAGKLKADFVVHVVAPVWKGGTNNEENLLEEVVITSLKKATSKKTTSIAFPAISCGGYGFPVKKATSVIVRAVKTFFRDEQDSSIKDVYLCDVKDETVDAFTQALVNEFGKSNVQTTDNRKTSNDGEEDYTYYRSSSDMKEPPPATRRGYSQRNTSDNSDEEDDSDDNAGSGAKKKPPAGAVRVLPSISKPRPKSKSDPSKPDSSIDQKISFGKISVSLKKAEIAKEQVDVIVNTTAKNLDLKNGAVSASLLKIGGPNLQTDVTSKYPNGIDLGEVAVSGGHNLSCKSVFHSTIPNYDANNESACLTVLHKLMTNCLTEATKQGHKSIAFPAIGTGNLGFPKDKVASEMFGAVSEFSTNFPTSSVQDVRFIVYQRDAQTITAFEDELEKCSSGQAGSASKKMRRDSRQVEDIYVRVSRKQEQRGDNDEEHIYEELPDDTDSCFANITVTVNQGDITKEDTDCIVNSSNDALDLSRGAVSKALLQKGGDAMMKEILDNRNDMKKKGFAWTTAPNLPCKHIIHIVAPEKTDGWKTIIDTCLKEADKKKLKSISFPALGTAMNIKPDAIAGAMRDSLTEFDQTVPTCLTEVRIVIFQTEMVQVFKDVMKTKAKGTDGILSKIVGGVADWWAGGNNKTSGTKPKASKSAHPDKVTFTITSMNNNVIQQAIQRLEAVLQNEIITKKITDSVIQRMDSNFLLEIKGIADDCKVQLKLDANSGKVEIAGMTQNVMNATDKIHNILRDASSHEKHMETAEIMSSLVQWFFIEINEEGQKLTEYDKGLNYQIESAFKSQAPTFKFKSVKGETYVVDFKNMKEYLETDPEDSVNLIRRDKTNEGTFDTPAIWGDFKGNLRVVNLAADDQDNKDIGQKFQATAGTPRQIKLIQRIQNRTLWQQYHAKKKQLEDQNPAGTKNENFLWHGTAEEAVDSINAHGFNRSYCGKNATALGNGVYFAVQSAYSCQDTYSRPDSQGVKRMYYCRVLTGEYAAGKSGMRVPPPKPAGGTTALYDSVVDNTAGPGMYIIFNDTQAYPEYLITFTN